MLRNRPTRGGPLEPVIISDVDDGVTVPVSVPPGTTIPVVPESGANFPVKFGDSPSIDAFARARFSEPFTLFDSKQIWDDPDIANNAENYPLFWDNQEVSGSGTTTTFSVNRASTTLAVSNATAGKRVRQSKQRFNYQPGKSQVGIFTCIDLDAGPGNAKEIGLFDDNDGLFFRSSAGGHSVVIRSFASGVAIDTEREQATWNKDLMNGNGASGVNLDFVKSQIPLVDFEWLGVGRVRFGWFVDGLPIYCHEFLNTNNLDVVYMSNPNLPVRASIENDGTGAADTFEQVCTTVISEGGIQPNGVLRFEDIGTLAANDIAAASPGVTYAVCGIKLKPAYLSADVREVFASLIENSGANNPFIWKLHLNPTIAAALTYSDVPNSAIQFGVGSGATPANNVISADGFVVGGGYQARQDANASVPLESALRLGALIDGTVDELVLSGSPLTNSQLYFGGLQWREAW
jgi:hypothetical protein